MNAAPDLAEAGARVEALLQRFDGVLAPPEARAVAEDLVRVLTELYGAGLERALEIVYDAAEERSAGIFGALAADPAVSQLLILHGLHPQTVEERVEAALERVRPYLNSHEGDITLIGIRDGIAHVRLSGSCHGCQASLATVKQSVEKAILEAAPELREVRAQGMTASSNGAAAESDWLSLQDHPTLAHGGFATLEVGGSPVLLVNSGARVNAFRNQCPRCLRSLSHATLAWPRITCAACAQTYDLAGSEEIAQAPALERFAVTLDIHDSSRIRVAIPVTA